MSALRSSAGPAVSVIATPSSSATIRARLVFPRPGGPANRTWSSGSPRARRGRSAGPGGGLGASWPPATAGQRRGERAPELRLERLLAEELVEPGGAQPRLVFVPVAHLRGLDAVDV